LLGPFYSILSFYLIFLPALPGFRDIARNILALVYISSAIQRFAEALRWNLYAESIFQLEQQNPTWIQTYLISIANETKNMSIRQDQPQIFRMSITFSPGWNLPILSAGSDRDPLKL
jgi:hypothetical protein